MALNLQTAAPKQNPAYFKNLGSSIQQTLYGFLKFPGFHNDSELAKLLWIVKLRWIAISFFFLLSAPAFALGFLSRDTLPPFLCVIGCLLIINLFTQLLWSEKKFPVQSVVICFQLALDLAALTALLYFSKGFANPLIALFLLNASLGGILIPGRLSLPFLLLTHSLLAALQLQFLFAQQPDDSVGFFTTVLIYHIMVFSFWLIMRSLGAYLERQHIRESQVKILSEKQDRLRSLGALAAGFSHEFASPLNTLKIRVERMFRIYPTEDAEEALKAIQACENVILQMNSSQLDSRDFKLKEVIMEDITRDIASTWKEEHPDTPVELKFTNSGSAMIPPINFAQVLLNLLDNAHESAPGLPIQVDLQQTKSEFTLCVRDQGPGFQPLIISQVGEPFVTSKVHGTGLGLYVSQLFVESLGGQLQINNLATSGAEVRLSWPTQNERATDV